MKSKTDLFHLIKAMSKSEKRYFTLDAQKSGRKDARYLELFQTINDMETYDEAALKSHFTNLHTDKAYLYDAILRSMRDYRSANSYAARIKEMIMDAKYLYERGLYEQSEERILSARELAEELGDQLSAIELNTEYRRLLKYTKKEGYENDIGSLISDGSILLGNLSEELFLSNIYDQLLIEVRNNRQGLKENQKEEFKSKYSQFLKILNDIPNIPQNRLRFYKCAALFYQLLNDSDKIHESHNKIIQYWDEIPKYKSEEFYTYIIDVSNLILNFLSNPTKFNQINQLLYKLENERPANAHNQNVLFQRITSFRLLYSLNTGDFTEVLTLTKRIEKGLKKYDIAPDTELSIIFNATFLLFMAEKYYLCQEWANKIIQQKKLLLRQDIQNASRILHLLATLEIGEFEPTEMSLRNTQRYLLKSSKSNSLYINILNFIKKIHTGNSPQSKNAYKQLKEYIITMQNSKEKIPLGIDELILYWVESKFSKRTISDIIKAGLAQNTH